MKKAAPDHDLSTERQPKLMDLARASGQAIAQKMSEETAQDVAVKAFIFLSVDAERARRFAAETGLGRENLRATAETPDLLHGVLDYLIGNESLLLAFTVNCGIDPADIDRARAVLSRFAEE